MDNEMLMLYEGEIKNEASDHVGFSLGQSIKEEPPEAEPSVESSNSTEALRVKQIESIYVKEENIQTGFTAEDSKVDPFVKKNTSYCKKYDDTETSCIEECKLHISEEKEDLRRENQKKRTDIANQTDCNIINIKEWEKYQKQNRFKCPLCNYRSGYKQHVQKHYKSVHQKIRPFQCLQCKQRFTAKSSLNSHIITIHKKLKRFQCLLCEHKCSVKSSLTTHVLTVHKKLKRYQCSSCKYKFANKTTLANHIFALHEKLKRFQCPHCEYKSTIRSSLKCHILAVHDKVKRFQCPQCEYKGKIKSILNNHVRTVHGKKEKKIQCPLCKYKCYTSKSLSRHNQAIHEGQFQCPECEFRYSDKLSFIKHVRVEPIRCSECEFTCKCRRILKKHIKKVHKRLTPFNCILCDYKCSFQCYLKRHVKNVHNPQKLKQNQSAEVPCLPAKVDTGHYMPKHAGSFESSTNSPSLSFVVNPADLSYGPYVNTLLPLVTTVFMPIYVLQGQPIPDDELS